MNKPVAILLRCLGFNRPVPKTRLGRNLRRAERTLSVLALLYAGLHVFPQVLFAHSVTESAFHQLTQPPKFPSWLHHPV